MFQNSHVVVIEGRQLYEGIPKDCVSRHPGGKNLHDIADVTIDAKIPYGDAVIQVDGAMNKTGPISNILIFFALHLIIIRSVEMLIAKGANPPIVMSANIPGSVSSRNM
jgi:uncharacterized phosphosugar-binding protein